MTFRWQENTIEIIRLLGARKIDTVQVRTSSSFLILTN